MIKQYDNSNKKSPVCSLRQATQKDLTFLFKVSTDAMKPVVETLNPDKKFDEGQELAKYKEKFDPEKIEVIQYEERRGSFTCC